MTSWLMLSVQSMSLIYDILCDGVLVGCVGMDDVFRNDFIHDQG